ncbi:MAG: glycosyltransferase [Lachnospiraceae bacterium]|nr:glycosyltransferase [Lachnospiraceae bacterium]
MKLSVITVSLNAGDKLLKTVESAAAQTFQDYELIIQDGGSLDGSLEALSDWLAVNEEMAARTRIFQEKDAGIYDGMNRGAAKAQGEYLYFLNCGDVFHEPNVLQEFAAGMEAAGATSKTAGTNQGLADAAQEAKGIFYGNVYDTLRASVVQSNPRMDAFGCYRNVPCHQACVYHRSLFQERGYSLQYRVRADYEHFLWCFLKKQVPAVFIPVTLADYEGGGFSETKENRRRSAAEHRRITALYMTKKQRFCYRAVLVLTLQPLRTALAENEMTGRFYQSVKRVLYHRG